MLITSIKTRFWNNVNKAGPRHPVLGTRCWEWLGSTIGNGYGQYQTLGECYAHRVSFRLNVGEIPKGIHVLHKCDNPICVNPDHLLLGTQQDNVDDMYKKGRQDHTRNARGDCHGLRIHPERIAKGERNGRAILTEEQVIWTRQRYSQGGITYPELSYLLGISQVRCIT